MDGNLWDLLLTLAHMAKTETQHNRRVGDEKGGGRGGEGHMFLWEPRKSRVDGGRQDMELFTKSATKTKVMDHN